MQGVCREINLQTFSFFYSKKSAQQMLCGLFWGKNERMFFNAIIEFISFEMKHININK